MVQSLSLINLFVRDVQWSREFYADVLEIPVLTPSDDQYVLLDIDGPQIYLHWTPSGTEVEYQHRGVELFFRVHDVDDVAQRLRAKGVEILKEPDDLGWQPWRFIMVVDPDGYVIFLASHKR